LPVRATAVFALVGPEYPQPANNAHIIAAITQKDNADPF